MVGVSGGVQREREEDVVKEAVAETASPATKRVKVRRCRDITT